jgi:hypothetical protein
VTGGPHRYSLLDRAAIELDPEAGALGEHQPVRDRRDEVQRSREQHRPGEGVRRHIK